MNKIRIISRSSELALSHVKEVTRHFPDIDFEQSYIPHLKEVQENYKASDSCIQIFTNELHQALRKGHADVAIYAANELPHPLPADLKLVALTKSVASSDALVSRGNIRLYDLKPGSKIGTSLEKRKKQLFQLRSDINVIKVHGTITERLKLIDNNTVDALILPASSLHFLGKSKLITQLLPFSTHPLQGQIAVVALADHKEMAHTFSKIDVSKNYGKVHMVGSGAGKADLITLRGYNLLKKADVILHDNLIDRDIFKGIKVRKLNVGKRMGKESTAQPQTNEIMYRLAKLGKNVVRLKGGDPMIFGHAGEEINFLRERQIQIQVVPGITTALTTAAQLQTSLTLKNVASSVSFCTAFPKESIEFPETDTIVYYMCSTYISYICKKLIKKGRDPETAITLAQRLNFSDEKIVNSTLQEIAASGEKFPTPMLAIISNALNVNNWYKAMEKKILFTGLTLPERNRTTQVIHKPYIEISSLSDFKKMDSIIENISAYHWIVFTSRHAVQYFFDRLLDVGKDVRWLSVNKIASIGNTTTKHLKQRGVTPDLQAADESSSGLIAEFNKLEDNNQHILIPRSNIGLPVLPEGLSKVGFQVEVVHVYENKPIIYPKKTKPNDFQEIIFSSPSGVKSFFSQVEPGEITAKLTCRGSETKKELIKYVKNLNSK